MKKNIIIVICTILLIALLSIVFIKKEKKEIKVVTENSETGYMTSSLADANGNIIYDPSRLNEIDEIIENTTIQGIVELNQNGYIYIYNGQHFGEYGVEMEEYTRANIDDRKQECIDYYTSKKYDTSYIQEGDVIFCTGDLIKYKYTMGENAFDTKDNPIIVLKSKDYDVIKKETINNEEPVIATVGDYYKYDTTGEKYERTGYIYIKYDAFDKGYNLPFAIKLDTTKDTEIIGNIERGSKVKVQYKNLSVTLKELELKSIEVIEK